MRPRGHGADPSEAPGSPSRSRSAPGRSAEILFDFAYGGDSALSRRPPTPSTSPSTRPATSACCCSSGPGSPSSAATLWFDGAMAAIAAAALGAAVLFEVVLRHTDGSTAVIVTNLAYPLGDILLLSAVDRRVRADRLAARPHLGADRRRARSRPRSPTRIFLFQTATDTYTRGHDPRRALARVDAAARRRGLATAASRRTSRSPGGRCSRRSLVCGADRPRDPQLRPLPPAEPPRGRASPARRSSPSIVRTGLTFRENARILELMRVARRHRRPHRPRQPAPARRRPRPGARRRRPGRSRGCS